MSRGAAWSRWQAGTSVCGHTSVCLACLGVPRQLHPRPGLLSCRGKRGQRRSAESTEVGGELRLWSARQVRPSRLRLAAPTSDSAAFAIFSFVPGSPGSRLWPSLRFRAIPIGNALPCPLSAHLRPALSCLQHLSCWQFPNQPPPRPSGKDTVAGLAPAVSSNPTHREGNSAAPTLLTPSNSFSSQWQHHLVSDANQNPGDQLRAERGKPSEV